MTIRLCQRLEDIGRAAWDALRTDDNPFTSYDFLQALEATGCVGDDTGWTPCHIALESDRAVTAAAPLYVKGHSSGEYVFDHAWARAWEQAGGRYYPKLVSAIPFTPVTGPRLLGATSANRAALADAIARVCRDNRLSSAHILFPTDVEGEDLKAEGWLSRYDYQYWWDNKGYSTFDDFLGELTANRRKVIRRERRDVAQAVTIRRLTGHEITEDHLDHLCAFIQDTYDRKWGQPYLTRDFFSVVTERLRERMLLVVACEGDTPVAAAINFIGNSTLYGRQWGCVRDIPFLHFELCYYQAIDFAIETGLRRVEAGTQGEHKLSRGYLPHLVRSAHYIPDARLAGPVARFLEQEREAVLTQMDEAHREGSPYKAGSDHG